MGVQSEFQIPTLECPDIAVLDMPIQQTKMLLHLIQVSIIFFSEGMLSSVLNIDFT